jgi:hypothetical protein
MEQGASASHRHGSVISSRALPIDVARRPPWNRWFFRTVHYWRYGYSHPDEDLLGVIDAVGDALNVHIMAARAELTGARALEADRIKAMLDDELKKELPDFSTLLGIEAMINAIYPPAMARRRQWLIRERFERVAPPGAFQSWRVAQMTSQLTQPEPPAEERPEDPQPEPPPEQATEPEGDSAAAAEEAASPSHSGGGAGGDAGGGNGGGSPPEPSGNAGGGAEPPLPSAEVDDTQTLLGYVHSNYLLSIAREKAVRDLKRWLLMRFWFFLLSSIPTLAIGGAILLWVGAERYWGLLLGLFLVVVAGRIGATTSVIRRMQTAISGNVLARDPILELTALRTGKNEISLALLTSSIFALLLYAFFLSGVPAMMGFSQGIFPEPARDVPGIVEREERAQEASPASAGEEETAPVDNAALADENEIAETVEGGEAVEPGAANETSPAPADGNLAAANGNLAAAETNQAESVEETASVNGNASAAADEAKRERKLDLSCQPGVDCDPFDDLARRLGLEGAVDFFKLLLWAFIAGFAERFVPDVLDRVVVRGRPRNNEDTEAVLAAHASVRNASGGRDPTAVVQSVTTVRNPPDSG